MTDIFASREAIRRHALDAAERAHFEPPRNPYPAGSEAHDEWRRALHAAAETLEIHFLRRRA